MKTLTLITLLTMALGIIFWKKIRMVCERIIAPSYSTCGKCGRPWKFVKEYTVMYDDRSGMFAVCEECWNNSTLPELKTYYGGVQKKWASDPAVGPNYCNYDNLMDSVESEFKRNHK